MAKTEYGLQLYSVRDITEKDLRTALKEVASLGYKYVEFAGFFGNTADKVKSWLDEYGLVVSGTHTCIDGIADDKIDETIAYHQALGCKNLIVPAADWSTEEKMNENIELLNRAQKKLSDAGISLGYHNHSAEFMKTNYGKVIEDELISRTSIELEIDTFWAFNAGKDPVELLESIKDRVSVIHLKDGIPTDPKNLNFAHVHDGATGLSVGLGKAPVKAIREWAIKNDVLMVVESEELDPTGIEEVKRCIDFLRTLDK